MDACLSRSPETPRRRKASARKIPAAPTKILDAPGLVDDYYLNLLDWGKNDILAVALAQAVYLWNAKTGQVSQLMQTYQSEDYVSSISWGEGNTLAVGLNSKTVQLWDSNTLQRTRVLDGHSGRVCALSWHNGHTLSSGGRDSVIINHDIRQHSPCSSRLLGHSQEVCGLEWSTCGQMLASGGNDNTLNIWDINNTSRPMHRSEDHKAAVKAIAWAPFQRNLLATGGGTADRCIKLWNTSNGTCLNSVDTQSQVCAIKWSLADKELVSSHGFSHNQLFVWKYPQMTHLSDLRGHTARVLHLTQSPDGSKIVSAAADETIKFWDVFRPKEKRCVDQETQFRARMLSHRKIR